MSEKVPSTIRRPVQPSSRPPVPRWMQEHWEQRGINLQRAVNRARLKTDQRRRAIERSGFDKEQVYGTLQKAFEEFRARGMRHEANQIRNAMEATREGIDVRDWPLPALPGMALGQEDLRDQRLEQGSNMKKPAKKAAKKTTKKPAKKAAKRGSKKSASRAAKFTGFTYDHVKHGKMAFVKANGDVMARHKMSQKPVKVGHIQRKDKTGYYAKTGRLYERTLGGK